MPDMDQIIRRIRRDMNTELRKRARRALDGPSGWAVSGEAVPGEQGEGGRSGEAAAPAASGPAQQGE